VTEEPQPETRSDKLIEWSLLISGPAMRLLWVPQAIPIAPGIGVSLFTDFGGTTSPDFFSTLAQIAPVITLAAMVDEAALHRKVLDETVEHDPDTRSVARHHMRLMVGRTLGSLAFAEMLCLYAVATSSSTTFLVVASATAVLMQVGIVASHHVGRY
jgi:hypothetical protein